jgi:hypothetical protein
VSHAWIEESGVDPLRIANFNMEEIFPPSSFCIHASYDYNEKILILIDGEGNIGSINFKYYDVAKYDDKGGNKSIHLEHILKFLDIIKFKKIIILSSSNNEEGSSVSFIGYNGGICQIVEYSSSTGIKNAFTINCFDGRPVCGIVKLDDSKKIYIIYKNQKIVELSTYLYSQYVFQKPKNQGYHVIGSGKTFCNTNESPVYITSNNKIFILHQLYNTNNRISELKLPLSKFISEGSYIKSYKEYFIEEGSVSLFTNSYYALSGYIHSKKYPLSKRA